MSKIITISIEDLWSNAAACTDEASANTPPKIIFNIKTNISPAQYERLYEDVNNAVLRLMNIDT
ncbi:MAG: hypothetical protein RQ756_09300 [Flavobacteriaceae bacterium]|nr:hypothetical protein [Flavobacteriaceae bacterium]